LERGVWEHRNHAVKGFTKIYTIDRLVYYEPFSDARDVIAREKALVRTQNPRWKDLGQKLFNRE
jgi:putative endonuclease